MPSRFKYIVAEEVDGLMAPARKLSITAPTPAFEELLYAAAGVSPGAFPPPYPVGATPIKRGTGPYTITNGFYAFERGGTYAVDINLTSGLKIVAYGDGAPPVLVFTNNARGAAILANGPSVKDLGGLYLENVALVPADPRALDRGDGIVVQGNIGPITWINVDVQGFEQNVTFSGNACVSPIIVTGLTTGGAWALNKTDLFKGQGVYFEATGPIVPVFNDLLSYNNGIALHAPEQWNTPEASMYCHGFYHQAASTRVKLVRPSFVHNQAAGFQTRSGADLIDPVFVDNAQSILNVGTMTGRTTVTNFIIIGAHRVFTGDSWDGLNAVTSYDPILLDRGTIIGVAGMDKPMPVIPGHKSGNYASAGCIQASSGRWSPSHPLCQVQQKNPDGSTFYGGTVEARQVRVISWLPKAPVLQGRAGGFPNPDVTINDTSPPPFIPLPSIGPGYNSQLRANVAAAALAK